MQPYALMPKQYYCFSTFKCFFILTGDFEVQNFHQITYIHFAIKNQRNMSKILHHFGGACPQKLPAVGSAVPCFQYLFSPFGRKSTWGLWTYVLCNDLSGTKRRGIYLLTCFIPFSVLLWVNCLIMDWTAQQHFSFPLVCFHSLVMVLTAFLCGSFIDWC